MKVLTEQYLFYYENNVLVVNSEIKKEEKQESNNLLINLRKAWAAEEFEKKAGRFLHPSSLNSYFDCPYRWYRDNFYKPIRRVGTAAYFGTGLHKASEVYYNECIKKGAYLTPHSELVSLSLDTFRERVKEEEPSDIKEVDILSIESNIIKSTQTYLNNAQMLNNDTLPVAVEKTYKRAFKTSRVFEGISGTLDIVGSDYIIDIKTMSRQKNAKTYLIQQGIYAVLREKEGEITNDLIIHRINTTNHTIDSVSILQETGLSMQHIKNYCKGLLHHIIRTTNLLEPKYNDIILPDRTCIFQGNPQSRLCSAKYCNYYDECSFGNVGLCKGSTDYD